MVVFLGEKFIHSTKQIPSEKADQMGKFIRQSTKKSDEKEQSKNPMLCLNSLSVD